MRREEFGDTCNMMIDTFAIKTQPVDALLDSGATLSFIFAKLIQTVG